MRDFSKPKENNTNICTETIAGLTAFFYDGMCYFCKLLYSFFASPGMSWYGVSVT
jgi:hypothetical protein